MYLLKNFFKPSAMILIITLFPYLLFTDLLSAEEQEPQKNHAYMGVASCASSNCHGSVSPRKSSSVLQNEYVTWIKKDKHAQAWKVLLSPESKKIGFNLNIEDPSKEKLCLDCHASSTEDQKNGIKFRSEDGVGCESCHGASEHWLAAHTSSSNSHADNVSQGLIPLDQPEVRANKCLECHLGDSNNPFSHRLYGAGHPRLSFELDTYSVIQPAHWLLDQDYKERKGDYIPLNMWLTGQRIAAAHTVNLIDNVAQQKASLFPELSVYTCSSCHHDLSRREFMNRDYRSHVGLPHFNVAPLRMVAVALSAVKSPTADQLSAKLDQLTATPDRQATEQLLSQIREIISRSEVGSSLEQASNEPQITLLALLRFASDDSSLYYETAEQIAMGVASAHAQITSGGPRSNELNQIFIALQAPDKFNPVDFSDACRKYLRTIK